MESIVVEPDVKIRRCTIHNNSEAIDNYRPLAFKSFNSLITLHANRGISENQYTAFTHVDLAEALKNQ